MWGELVGGEGVLGERGAAPAFLAAALPQKPPLYAASLERAVFGGFANSRKIERMPHNSRIRLLFSLSAALPFSESSGHPVFSWRASLPCGHLLGLLFRALGGRVDEVEVEEAEDGEGAEVATEEEEGASAGEVGDGENPPQQTCSTSPPPRRQQPPIAEKTKSEPTTILDFELHSSL